MNSPELRASLLGINEVRRLKNESKIDDFSQGNTQNKDGDAELEKLLKHLHENQQKNGQI